MDIPKIAINIRVREMEKQIACDEANRMVAIDLDEYRLQKTELNRNRISVYFEKPNRQQYQCHDIVCFNCSRRISSS